MIFGMNISILCAIFCFIIIALLNTGKITCIFQDSEFKKTTCNPTDKVSKCFCLRIYKNEHRGLLCILAHVGLWILIMGLLSLAISKKGVFPLLFILAFFHTLIIYFRVDFDDDDSGY